MANTTFSGPIRSESTLKTISKNATTVTITEVITLGGAPVSLADSAVTLTNATHSGRILLVPDGSQDNTYTLPAPIAGSMFRFVYAGGAADATDALIITPGNTTFNIGGITHLDTNADNVAIFSDGDSNEMLTITTPQTIDVHCLALSTTVWYIWGTACSVTAPAFAD